MRDHFEAMESVEQKLPTSQKALQINLDECKYGTFVEIGAGQEVARQFFQAGAAAGTVAKTMSAYDMQVSDAIYGETASGRYVSRERLETMLGREFDLLVERLESSRPKNTTFFSFAATVAARSYSGKGECHGWLGVRLQLYPRAPASEIVLHVRMLDKEARSQQQALGVLGVNLIHSAFNDFRSPKKIIGSLQDGLVDGRIEVDLIHFSGPYFEETDNRLMNLELIRQWLCRAILFNSHGEVVVPRDLLYKKHVLAIRGTFKPVTRVNVDMIECGLRQFLEVERLDPADVVVLAEITMAALVSGDEVDNADFLARCDLLTALGYTVLVSDYLRYFRLRAFFRRYTRKQIGIVLGVPNLREIFAEHYYEGIEGGMLEALGKLFPDNTRLYVYPAREARDSNELTTADNIDLGDELQPLYEYLHKSRKVVPLLGADTGLLDIFSVEVLRALREGEAGWEEKVPETVAQLIRERRLLGYRD